MKHALSIFLFVLVATAFQCAPPPAPRPPNIVLFLADDLGYAELGSYGQQIIRTPNLDRLAAEGMRFTQHYAGNAVCAPSRSTLMTGQHAGHTYIRDNGDPRGLDSLKTRYGWEFPGQYPIPDETFTLAEMLKGQGYATAAIGKWGLGHVGTSGDATRQGFDLFYGYYCQRHAHNHYPRFLWRNDEKEVLPGNDRTLSGQTYSQDRFIEEGMAFIREQREQPFFLYMPFTVPHLSIQAPDSSVAEYAGVIPEEPYTHTAYLEHPTPRAGYAAMITHLDQGVGQIMHLLRELGLDENTLVLFTSDNGPTFNRLGGSDSEFFQSAGGFKGLKGSLYEGGIRVPLIARWPGHIAAGTESEHISAFWDMMPTLAELTGAPAPDGIDGVSFAPTLLGQTAVQQQHELLYWEFPAYGGQQAARMGSWKAIRQNMLASDNRDPLRIELYDLDADPGETTDVALEHPEIAARFAGAMREARTPSTLFPFPPIDP